MYLREALLLPELGGSKLHATFFNEKSLNTVKS